MQNKKIIAGIVIAVIIVGLSFWLGFHYGQGQNKIVALDRQGFNQNPRTGARGSMNGGFISGSILARDDKSLTVELRNGGNKDSQNVGSKIVLFSPTTSIDKSVTGTSTDLAVGNQVTVIGTTNPDGSISATSIQIKGALK